MIEVAHNGSERSLLWRASSSTAGLLEYARVSRFRPSGIYKPADRPQMGVNLQFQWIAVAVLLSNAVELFDRDVLFVSSPFTYLSCPTALVSHPASITSDECRNFVLAHQARGDFGAWATCGMDAGARS